MFHHTKGALPIFKRWIEEQKLLLNQLGGGEIQVISDVKKMEKELECDKCNMPISNFFITPSKKKYVCLKCGSQRQKGHHRVPIQVHYRLFDIATAERIVEKVSKKISSDKDRTLDVTPIINQPNTDEVEIIVGEFWDVWIAPFKTKCLFIRFKSVKGQYQTAKKAKIE